MRRRLTALAVAVAVAGGGCGGPSDKEQATKVALAWRRAAVFHDYAAEWNLIQQQDRGGYRTANEYAQAQLQANGPSVASPTTKLTVETATKEGSYFRVRIRVTDPAPPSFDRATDVIVGKYGSKWLVAGSVEPGHPITSAVVP